VAADRPPIAQPLRWLVFAGSFALVAVALSQVPTRDPPGEVTPGPWTSALPPLLAVWVAAFFRRVIEALLSAVVLGTALAFGVDLAEGARAFLWANVADPFNLAIVGFTFALVGMVNVTSRSGGNQGLVDAVARLANGPRSTRVATGLMGLAIFFDDYANSVVVGTTMRRLTDGWRISREKLAYLVDSTAAPIAGLALISTWIAYEVGLFAEVGQEIGLELGGYQLFLAVLPFRFYCLAALAVVFAGALSGRDFGPMRDAECRAAETGAVHGPDAEPLGGGSLDATRPPEDAPHRWGNAVLPIAVVVFGVMGGMLWSGRGAVAEAGVPFDLFDGRVWRLAFGGADSAQVLLVASLVGSAVAIGLAVGQGTLGLKEAGVAWLRTFPAMASTVAVLILAWAIKSVCLELGTDRFILSALGEDVPLTVLPLVIFGLAAVTAFATGTSFGTMGILLPVALPLAHGVAGGEVTLELYLVGAAVLDGAIFGDHCSPISDTTVLSSAATGCDHIDHVRTQVPYAVTGMLLAALAGYLALALGTPRWVPYLLIPAGAAAAFLVIGRPVTGSGQAVRPGTGSGPDSTLRR